MPYKISSQRSIIDRTAVQDRLDDLLAQDLPKPKRRAGLLDIIRQAYHAGYAEVRRRFEAGGSGPDSVHEQCFLVDQLIRLVYDFASIHEYPSGVSSKTQAISVAAVGGYGRGELSPHSDIDLLFLLPYKQTSHAEQIVEFMLYLLWDLGLKVGHATRSIDDCIRLAKSDLTIRTALLEARWLWGDQALFAEMCKRYREDIVAGTAEEFIEGKLAERDQRHGKLGDTRYVLEPNVKDGKGGLRDLHTLYWLTKYIYGVNDIRDLVSQGILSSDSVNRFVKAQAFLWTVRCHLHYQTGRLDDRLTFDMQPEIARRMGYTDHGGALGVERFMKHYFLIAKDVGDLTRIICALLEEGQRRKPKLRFPNLSKLRKADGFRVENGRLDVLEPTDFETAPIQMIRIFATALANELDIHPHALSLITRNLKRIDNQLRQNPEANRLFLEMLTSRKDPEVALRHMNEAGVLGRFIPDFGRVVAQMQYDMYHVFTVDEHTIQAIGILHRIEKGLFSDELPVATEAIQSIQSRRALYLSVFLHDIAKGRNGDHSELGAEIALKLGPRLGLTDEETETTSWLVRQHLLMTRTAFKRDIGDPSTIADFVAAVQSPERLRLLTLLTIADVTAVGPNVWNNWKAGLLRELYLRSLESMSGGLSVERREARVEAAQVGLRGKLEREGWSSEDIDAHINRGYPAYWVSFDNDTLLHHAHMIGEATRSNAPITLDWRQHPQRGVTEVTLYAIDHAGLFSQVAGAMALAGASVIDAKIVTLANGMALDSFVIQDASGVIFDNPARLTKLGGLVEQALAGRLRLDRELVQRRQTHPSRNRVFQVPPRVLINNNASARHTIIEINGRDRVGLLYDITAAMTRLSIQISSAHISTYGERIVDVFYVKDLFGHKIEHERKIKAIREAILTALQDVAPEQTQKPAKSVSAAQ